MKLLIVYFTILLGLTRLTSASSYDYYVFASEWAGSVCNTEDCTSQYTQGLNPTFMNIHGLWPSSDNEEAPSYCGGPAFDLNKISQKTQNYMIADWSGLYSSALSFHQHEWEKHGSCWNDPDSESEDVINDFFTKVIDIAHSFDVYNELHLRGIVPSDSEYYELDDVQNALQDIYGYSGEIQCLKSDSGETLFNGVYMCLDLDYNPRECPDSAIFTSDCSGRLYFPILDLSFGHNVETKNTFQKVDIIKIASSFINIYMVCYEKYMLYINWYILITIPIISIYKYTSYMSISQALI